MKKTLHTLALTLAAAALVGTTLPAAAAEGLRPELGKPLQQAGDLLRAGKAREALAKVREAEAVGAKNGSETLTINRMKAAAAQRAGDSNTAIQALEAIYRAVPGDREQGQIAEQLASAYAQARNNGKASEWVAKAINDGNNSSTIRQLQSYLQSVSGDYAAIARDSGAAVAAAEQAGRRPDENDLLRLADAQMRLNNAPAQAATLEKLVFSYPKKEYWNAYLSRLPRKSGYSSRLSLDVLRLQLATGNLDKTSEFMEMAQLSLQAGLPEEALKIIDQGTKAGLLGTGAEAARHQRLRDLAVKQAAASKAGIDADAASATDPDEMVKIGYTYASLGQVDKGVALIEAGIKKGSLRRPEEAQLRLGMAQLQSAASKTAGMKTLRGVKAKDGTAEVARAWTVIGTP